MVQPGRIRVALDAHVVGRRGTGNETYVVGSPRPGRTFRRRTARAPRRGDVVARAGAAADPTAPPPFGASCGSRSSCRSGRRVRADSCTSSTSRRRSPACRWSPRSTTCPSRTCRSLFRRPTELRLKLSVRATARKAAAIVAISAFTRGRLIERYGVPPERVVVTPVAVSPFWRPVDRTSVPACWPGRARARPAVRPRRRQPPSPQEPAAAHPLRRRDPGRRARRLGLVLVGQRGWQATEVDAAIDAVGGRDWVTFTGFVDDEALRPCTGRPGPRLRLAVRGSRPAGARGPGVGRPWSSRARRPRSRRPPAMRRCWSTRGRGCTCRGDLRGGHQ